MKMAIACLVILLMSCTGQQAGGPSSVETQNSIAATLLLPNGSALAHAKIQLMYADQAQSKPLQESITDSLGNFAFQVSDSAYYSVVAVGDSGVFWRALRKAELQADSQKVMVHSTKPITVYLKLKPNSWGVGQGMDVFVLGVGERGRWYGDSIFAMSLPGEGDYAIRLVGDQGLREEFFRANSLDTIQLELSQETSISLLDFESNCMQNNLRLLAGESWNFIVVGTGLLEPSAAPNNFGLACTQDEERGGFARISYDAQGSKPWVVMGTVLGQNDIGINLNQMDSVEFWAKGIGQAQLGFVTSDMIDLDDYLYVRSPNVELTEVWTRYVFSFHELAYPAGSDALKNGLQWLESAKKVLFLQFNLMTSGELSIDGVRIFGVSYENL